MKLEKPGATPLGGPDAAAAREAERAKLRRASQAMEGVFVRQLFEAMRRATPQEGSDGSSYARSTFTSMLDDALAGEAAQHMQRGIGDALFRQLSHRLAGGGAGATPPKPAPTAMPLGPTREGDDR